MKERQAGPSYGVERQGKAPQGTGIRQSTKSNNPTAQFPQFLEISSSAEPSIGAWSAAHLQRCSYDSGARPSHRRAPGTEQTQLSIKATEDPASTSNVAAMQDGGTKQHVLAGRPHSGSTGSFHTSYLVDEESLESTIKESLSILGELEDGDEQNFYGSSTLASRFASLDTPDASFPAQARGHADGQGPRDGLGRLRPFESWTVAEAAGDKPARPGVSNVQKTEPLHISVERAIREAALACQASTGLISKGKRRSVSGLASKLNRMREDSATPEVEPSNSVREDPVMQSVRPAAHSYFSAVPQLFQPPNVAPQHGQRQGGAKPGLGGTGATQARKTALSSHARSRHLPKTVLLSHGRTAVLTGMPLHYVITNFSPSPLCLSSLPSVCLCSSQAYCLPTAKDLH